MLRKQGLSTLPLCGRDCSPQMAAYVKTGRYLTLVSLSGLSQT